MTAANLAVRSRSRSPRWRRRLTVLSFLSPWIVGFCAFIAGPTIASLYYGFTQFSIFTAPTWVGLSNYTTLASDANFQLALANTVYMVVIGVPAIQLFALLTALLLSLNVRGIGFYRTIYFLPAVMPAVPVVILWMWIFNPALGLVNGILDAVHLPGPGWIASPDWSKPVLIMLGMWQSGTVAAIYIAALQNVPAHLYEAAIVDGARAWARFRHITIPMITPVILFNTIVGVIWAFNYFTGAFIVGTVGSNVSAVDAGAPQGSLLLYAVYLYVNAFAYLKMGYASAMAWVLFLIILVCTFVLLKSSNRWVHYDQI